MTTKTLASASACAVTLLMAGCGGEIRYPNYYALEIPPAPRPAASDTRLSVTVAVRQFEAPPYLRQGGSYIGQLRKKLVITTIIGGLPIPL